MPSSSKVGQERIEALQSYLAASFPAAIIQSGLQNTQNPLTVLILPHAVYGFAICETDMRKDFEATYSAFKKLIFAGREVQTLEPAFIFCIAHDAVDAEPFISSVETDVYFCRKFVIGLSDNIGSSLAPLPFMPLAPIDGTALRPKSAQTFLQQCGVLPSLAKQLVVPHERSARGIFEDCVAGKQGDPVSLNSGNQKGMREVASSDSEVILERVIIRNVRAYRKEQEFKLGQSITVLYGPNGFGKTSFFDAIDFGITGSIGRLPHRNDAHFRKTVQHLDSGGEDAYVSIVYNRDGERNTISRRVAKPMTAQLNGVASERKRVLSALTSTSAQASERVDNYISLFRATHLFSQEQQELTKNFRTDCELSTTVISRMLAVEDYVSAKAKAEEVRTIFSDAIVKCDEEIVNVTKNIADDNQQLRSLRAAAAELSSPVAIQAEIAAITARLVKERLSSGDEPGTIDSLREQRAGLDGAIGQRQSALERLGSLVGPVSEMPDLLATLRTVERQIAETQEAVNETLTRLTGASEEFDAARQAFAAAERDVAQTRKAVEDHAWFSSSLSEFRQSDRLAREAEQNLRHEAAAVATAQAEERRVNDYIRGLEADSGPIAELLSLKRAQSGRLEALLAMLPMQRRKADRSRDIVASEQRIEIELTQQTKNGPPSKAN
jgi:exonuclease SbcC